MKIEIGESLGYSYLRHVKQCWLVQTNWKSSEHWDRNKVDADLEALFEAMKEKFDPDGSVFKQTKGAAQLLKQAEIDVVGVDLNGNVHVIEVAFHESGLNYGSVDETGSWVLKKLCRTMMALNAYHPPETKFHICFASPKVNPGVEKALKDIFAGLKAEYPEIHWDLIINHDFTDELVRPTLEKTAMVADSSELFARAAKLLDFTGTSPAGVVNPTSEKETLRRLYENDRTGQIPKKTASPERGLQPVVCSLMRTLLEDWPTSLDDADLRKLMSPNYCKNNLNLKLGNHALLRAREDGRMISGHARYWVKVYAGKFYVCSQWWKKDHRSNARALLRFAANLVERTPDHPGTPALERHQKALREYIEQA